MLSEEPLAQRVVFGGKVNCHSNLKGSAPLWQDRFGRALTPPRDRELSHKRVSDQRVRTGNADQDQFRASLTVTLQLELRICLLARQRIARSFIKTVSHCQGCVRRVLLDARRRIFQEGAGEV